MDRLERPLVNLPLLLDPSSYVPDTVDLTDDALARKYWLTCFEEALDGVRGWGVADAVCRHSRASGGVVQGRGASVSEARGMPVGASVDV